MEALIARTRTPVAVRAAGPPPSTLTIPPPRHSSLVGRRIGNFVVERELGRGGFGAVYLARHVDTELALHQVVKVLHPELSHRPEIVDRFRGEARAAAALSHPGIVHVEDFGQLDTGEQYISMEHLVGTDLAAWLEQRGRLDLNEALSLLEQAADALDAAHRRGIVHRDLKPSNLFRLADGRLKVLDFGIAKLMGDLARPGHQTATGVVMGTPHYMAPEQAISGMTRATPSADVFALGVIAYEIITGARPWSGATIAEHVLEINKGCPDPRVLRRDLPVACANAIVSALDPLPACRPPTAGEFVRMLREGVAARRRSRRAAYLALAVGGACLVATGVVFGAALGSTDNDASPVATAEPNTAVDPHPIPSPSIVASDHPLAVTTPTRASPPPVAPALKQTPAPPPLPTPPTTGTVPAAAGAADAAPRSRTGGLRISSVPDVADVFIGGKFQCSTEPPCVLTLATGQHRITLQNPRTSAERAVWVTVLPGGQAHLDATW
jgi:eukaryotic-like serine/threonine-protein kinase